MIIRLMIFLFKNII